MKFDLVISDFDRTLGGAPDFIEESTVKAIKEYEKKGGKFVICTGRMFSSIRAICIKYGFKGAVIAYQGSMICDIDSGKQLFVGGIENALAAKIAGELLEEGVDVIADVDDVLYYQKHTPYTDFYEKATVVKGQFVPDLVKFIKEDGRAFQKIAGICGENTSKMLTEKYNLLYKGHLTFNNGSPVLVEVINSDFGKGFAVKFIADYYNIPLERVLTVGDSTNDLELVGGAWYGVAVGDAVEGLKRIAKEVTVPYKDKPVEVLLKKYCI